MIIQIDRETKIALLHALKVGYLDTLTIPALYGEQFNLFLDLMQEVSAADVEANNTNQLPDENRNNKGA